MTQDRRFDVRLSPEALKEYNSLDNSVLDIVNNAIDDLELRAEKLERLCETMQILNWLGAKKRN